MPVRARSIGGKYSDGESPGSAKAKKCGTASAEALGDVIESDGRDWYQVCDLFRGRLTRYGIMAVNVARVKPYFYVFAFLVFLGLLRDLVNANRSDLEALRWHLKNGSQAQCCGIEIKVPLKYARGDGPGISLTNLPGRFRRTYFHSPFSMVSVNSIHRVESSDEEHQMELGKVKSLP